MDRKCIGRHAYIVLTAMGNNRMWTLSELKTVTRLDDRDLYMAIGWLAHEGAICFCTIEEECRLSLGMNLYI